MGEKSFFLFVFSKLIRLHLAVSWWASKFNSENKNLPTCHFYSPSRTVSFPVISSLQESDGRFTTDRLRSAERLSRWIQFRFCEARLCGAQSLSLLESPTISRVSRPVRMSLIEKDEKLNVMVKVCARVFPALSRTVCLETLTQEPLRNKSLNRCFASSLIAPI